MKNDSTNSVDKSSNKKVKTKRKMKIDWKMLYPILAILVFGALSLIAFVSMGFIISDKSVADRGALLMPVGKLKGQNPTYGAIISGIVIAWVTIVVPFAMMFWSPSRKTTKWIGIIPLVLTVLAGVLMFAGIGLFIRDFKTFTGLENYKANGGAITGIIIILVVGWLIALAGIARGFFDFNFWTAKSTIKPAKIVINETKPTNPVDASNPKLSDRAAEKKPVVHQETSAGTTPVNRPAPQPEIDEEQTITVGSFNRSSTKKDDSK